MENHPERTGQRLPPYSVNPNNYGNSLYPYEDRRAQLRRERDLHIKRSRNRLAFIMAMAHGAVELSLRREPRRVRQVVRGDLDRRYGFKSPRLTNP
jgi:hypothetical protein